MFSWCVWSPDWYSAQCAVGSLMDPLIGFKAMILALAWPHKNCFSSSARSNRWERFSNLVQLLTSTQPYTLMNEFHNGCERVWQHSFISILYCTFFSKKLSRNPPPPSTTSWQGTTPKTFLQLLKSWNKHSLRGILPKSNTATPIFEGPMFRVLHKALHGNLRSLRPNVAFTTNKCQNWMYKVYAYKHTHTNAINQLIDYRTSTSVWDELWWLEYVNGKHGNTTQYRYWYLFASCQSMPKQQIKQKTRCKPSIWWSDCWLPFGLDTTFRSWFGQLWELVQPSHYCCIRYANICSHPS